LVAAAAVGGGNGGGGGNDDDDDDDGARKNEVHHPSAVSEEHGTNRAFTDTNDAEKVVLCGLVLEPLLTAPNGKEYRRCLCINEDGNQCDQRAQRHAPGSHPEGFLDRCAIHASVKDGGRYRIITQSDRSVANGRCTHVDQQTGEGCSTPASFGKKSDGKKLFCAPHAKVENDGLKEDEEEHVQLGRQICTHEGCSTRATFGKKSDGKRLFCGPHAKVENAGLKKGEEEHVQLDRQICTHEGCSTYASFGKKSDGKKLFCAPHAKVENAGLKKGEEEHVNLTVPICVNCKTMPAYYRVAVVVAKEDGSANELVYEWRCRDCATWKSDEDMGDENAYTEKPGEKKPKAARTYMRKEYLTVQGFQKRAEDEGYTEMIFVHNRVLKTDSCDCQHRRRPDMALIVHSLSEGGVAGEGPPVLIVFECDENMHKSYKKEDVIARVNDIRMAWGVNGVVEFRFNPDAYLPKNGVQKRTGFFVGRGKVEDKNEIEYRLNVAWDKFKELVQFIQTNKEQTFYESIYVFYDGHDDTEFPSREWEL
jgi:hypothetical protein